MSRRFAGGDPDFGSDSFLDIVCNIVGILIILIVVVGVRVQRQPPLPDPVADNQETAIQLPAQQHSREQQRQLQQMAQRRRQLLAERSEAHEAARQLQQNEAELQSENTEISARIQAAEQQLLTARTQRQEHDQQQLADAAERRQTNARIQLLQTQLAERRQRVQFFAASRAESEELRTSVLQEIDSAAVETLQLQEQLQSKPAESPPSDRLLHRFAPLGKAVDSGEHHFRLNSGRISKIPLESLLDLLKAQLRSRQAVILRLHEFQGTVGPVSGYTMRYQVEKQGPSPLQALQMGDNRLVLQVSRWELVAGDELYEESAAESLLPGSRFRSDLETLPPESAVTIWVYENSFADFPPLRELAHSLQLRVAARPLPEGTPIIGSPGGSRSSAQ